MGLNKLEHTILRLNNLDEYIPRSERADYDEVNFYATMEDKRKKCNTVKLTIQNGFVQCGSSSALSTNGWAAQAFAVQRALEFVRLSGLRDSRDEASTTMRDGNFDHNKMIG